MATYTVVDNDKDPLDPGEVHAGTISVSDGDVFIIDPSVDTNVLFEDASGTASFDIQINASNSNTSKITVGGDLTPTITIADSVVAPNIDLDVISSDAANLNIGDNVELGKYDGSSNGADTITIGNGFTTADNWTLGDGSNSMTVGDNGTFVNITGGKDDDTLIFGNGTTLGEIDALDGADYIEFGDDLVASKIKGGKGDDIIKVGLNASVPTVDGQDGNDSFFTQTEGLNDSNMEYSRVVCFARGTRIDTAGGPVAVERLRAGHLVRTADRGCQPVLWIGSTRIGAAALGRDVRLRPIRISAGALGGGLPARDLLVSPQHRVLIRSEIARRMFGTAEVFVAAKKLTALPGIDVVAPSGGVEYFHLLLDRHAVVFSECAATESLYLGEQALEALGPRAMREIEACRRRAGPDGGLARPCPKGARVRRLLARHLANDKPVYEVAPTERSLRAG